MSEPSGPALGPHLPGLVVRRLQKSFPGQVALAGVDLHLQPGEIHALLGQNGSGKSTLIKILAGFHQPDGDGEAWVHGRPLALGSASAAHHAGLRFIHQDLGLLPTLDVVDNLALGQSYDARWWLSDRRERAAARALLAELELDLDVTQPVGRLSAAERTIVAVARSLRGGLSARGVLVLDEPTASLPAAEVGRLFRLIRTVAARGAAVLYVTHRMSEVFDLADRVTVLRDGRRVVTAPVGEVTRAGLVELIVGRAVADFYPEPPTPGRETALEARELLTPRLRGLSFTAHRGEILGIAGITGSGREDVAPALFGAIALTGGQVATRSGAVSPLTPAAAIGAGIAYLPSDRKRESAIPSFTVRENLTLPHLSTRRGWLGNRRERSDADRWLADLDVRPPGSDRVFSTLSGGNQQKVVLARWLRCGSTVLVLDEPTQGVDVGAKSMIYQLLTGAARNGASVIVASSDTEELAALCDRVIVVRDGVAGAELTGSGLTVDAISRLALTARMAS
ncbi:MAG TPA: sugar ABC transporter ATP-binding protein [Acidimicrobiales bacterium]|jgi:ribose transport system ATP-binding protein|nr:sugar ABC transporter ATP-binding protein [Acidimicrobiales bacterium]